jgi:putative CocE/NonD family hydrolase
MRYFFESGATGIVNRVTGAVTGPISLILYVSTTATSTDFTAKLVDVHRDASAFNISEGILRRSYQEAQGPSAAEKVHEIHLELWPTSMVFFKGHRIRLQVSSSNFPRFDRNPNTGKRIASEVNVIPLAAGKGVDSWSWWRAPLPSVHCVRISATANFS